VPFYRVAEVVERAIHSVAIAIQTAYAWHFGLIRTFSGLRSLLLDEQLGSCIPLHICMSSGDMFYRRVEPSKRSALADVVALALVSTSRRFMAIWYLATVNRIA